MSNSGTGSRGQDRGHLPLRTQSRGRHRSRGLRHLVRAGFGCSSPSGGGLGLSALARADRTPDYGRRGPTYPGYRDGTSARPRRSTEHPRCTGAILSVSQPMPPSDHPEEERHILPGAQSPLPWVVSAVPVRPYGLPFSGRFTGPPLRDGDRPARRANDGSAARGSGCGVTRSPLPRRDEPGTIRDPPCP